jgi:hypothetical protein
VVVDFDPSSFFSHFAIGNHFPNVSVLMAVVAVPLSGCEVRANFYHCIGGRNSNMIVIRCNHCSRAIKIRRD